MGDSERGMAGGGEGRAISGSAPAERARLTSFPFEGTTNIALVIADRCHGLQPELDRYHPKNSARSRKHSEFTEGGRAHGSAALSSFCPISIFRCNGPDDNVWYAHSDRRCRNTIPENLHYAAR
jgi:hypothetical protein